MRVAFVLLCFVVAVGCRSQVADFDKSDVVVSVVSSLVRNADESVYIDASLLGIFDKEKTVGMLLEKKLKFQFVNSDSLYASDSLWMAEKGLKHPIITFDSLAFEGGVVSVNVSKVYSGLSGESYQMDLKGCDSSCSVAKKVLNWRS